MLFCGMAFATLILLFGLRVLLAMTHYVDEVSEGLPVQPEYRLKAPLKIGTTNAEFAELQEFNDLLGNAAGYFNGYLSDEPLNLDARYVASEVTPATMRAVGDQMVDSMEGIMSFMVGMSAAIFLVLMYLLTKTVIDRAARSISYMKVFGCTDREISALYVRGITATVAVSLVACLPVVSAIIVAFMRAVYMKYSGNITPCITPESLAIDLVCGLATYAVVAWLHLRSVRRVPLSLALKVQE